MRRGIAGVNTEIISGKTSIANYKVCISKGILLIDTSCFKFHLIMVDSIGSINKIERCKPVYGVVKALPSASSPLPLTVWRPLQWCQNFERLGVHFKMTLDIVLQAVGSSSNDDKMRYLTLVNQHFHFSTHSFFTLTISTSSGARVNLAKINYLNHGMDNETNHPRCNISGNWLH